MAVAAAAAIAWAAWKTQPTQGQRLSLTALPGQAHTDALPALVLVLGQAVAVMAVHGSDVDAESLVDISFTKKRDRASLTYILENM